MEGIDAPSLAVTPLWRRWPLIGVAIAFALTITVYAAFALSIPSETGGANPRDAYYNRLVDGLCHAHLYLDKATPKALLDLKDPYDPVANAQSRGVPYTPTCIHDLSYYRGRLYLYFSVVPALVLFLPYHLLTGGYLSQQVASLILAIAAFVSIATLFLSVLARASKRDRPVFAGVGVLALGLASFVPAIIQRPDVYEVPVLAAYLFRMLALWVVWRCFAQRDGNWKSCALLSLCVGLDIACRPSDLPTGILLVIPLIGAWQRWRSSSAHPAAIIGRIFATLGPAVAVGIGLMLYNYFRFDNPLEFGLHYQLNLDPRDQAKFGLGFFVHSFRENFLYFPGFTRHFPWAGSGHRNHVTIDEIGLLAAVPFVIFAVFTPLAWFRFPRLRVIIAAVAGTALLNALLLCCYFSTSSRYELSFSPEMLLLSLIAAGALDDLLADRSPALKCGMQIACCTLLLASCAYGVLLGIRRRGPNLGILGTTYIAEGNIAAGLLQYERNVWCDPDDATALDMVGALLSRDVKNDDRAVSYYRRALRLDPNFAEAHNNIALILRKSPASRSEAIEHLRAAIQLKPDYISPRLALASLLSADRAQTLEVIRLYKEVLPLVDEDNQLAIHRKLADLLLRLNRYADARRELEEVVRMSPDDATDRNSLGALLALDPQLVPEAIEQFRIAVQLAPDFAEAHNNLGILLERNPQTVHEAQHELELALRLKPNYPEARQSLDALLRSHAIN